MTVIMSIINMDDLGGIKKIKGVKKVAAADIVLFMGILVINRSMRHMSFMTDIIVLKWSKSSFLHTVLKDGQLPCIYTCLCCKTSLKIMCTKDPFDTTSDFSYKIIKL